METNKQEIANHTSVSATQESDRVLQLIADAARDPAVDPAKLSALFDLKERMMAKHAEIEANQAFARVCVAMPRITKSGKIDFGKGNKPIPYAKWEDIHEAIKPIYEAEHFNLSYDTLPKEGGGLVTIAKLRHDNGHLITSSFGVPLDTSGGKQNIQGMGSSSSYGIRYSTRNLFNLVFEGEDDDGVKGAQVYIEDSQVKQVSDLVAETKTNLTAFLQMIGHSSIDNITKAELPMVINLLMEKKRQQTAKKG